MRRQATSFSLILCGLCFIFGGLISLTSAPVVSAKPGLAPSPRPPVERPTDESRRSDNDGGDRPGYAPATGRITGTIIDAATGAPAPGVTVIINGVPVTSDANGNYDKWVPVGSYTVGLMLVGQQADDLQGPQSVEVRAGETTVQHLYFRSAQAPTATAVPFPTPTAPPAPDLPVDSLPDTGVARTKDAPAKPPQPPVRPTHLPLTSVPADSSLLWLALGVGLVVVGTMVGVSGRWAARRSLPRHRAARRPASNDPLLAALLAAHEDEVLLRSLLNESDA